MPCSDTYGHSNFRHHDTGPEFVWLSASLLLSQLAPLMDVLIGLLALNSWRGCIPAASAASEVAQGPQVEEGVALVCCEHLLNSVAGCRSGQGKPSGLLRGHPAKLLKSSRVKPSGAVFDRTRLRDMYKTKMECEAPLTITDVHCAWADTPMLVPSELSIMSLPPPLHQGKEYFNKAHQGDCHWICLCTKQQSQSLRHAVVYIHYTAASSLAIGTASWLLDDKYGTHARVGVCTGAKMPDGYIAEDGRQDLRRFVMETTKDWESHAQKLAAARAAPRQGREPLSLMVRHCHCPSQDWHGAALCVMKRVRRVLRGKSCPVYGHIISQLADLEIAQIGCIGILYPSA